MTYFFVSFEPQLEKSFLKRFSFLGNAVSIKNKQQLGEALLSLPKDAFFLVHFKGTKIERDDQVRLIRRDCPRGKIIYVVEGQTVQELKAHQLSSVGGDAYVDFQTKEEGLSQLIEGLKNQVLPPVLAGDATSFADSAAIFDRFSNDPVSRSLDSTFESVIKVQAKQPLWQSATKLKEVNTLNDLGAEELGEDMSDKDQELSLDDLGELEIGDDTSGAANERLDFDLNLDDDLSLDHTATGTEIDLTNAGLDISDMDLSGPEEKDTNLSISQIADLRGGDNDLMLSDETNLGLEFPEFSLEDDAGLDFGEIPSGERSDLSADAREKLKEIDEIMVKDATQNSIIIQNLAAGDDLIMDASLDEPLVSDDLNLDSLNFANNDDDEPTRVRVLSEVDEPTGIKVLQDEDLEEEVIEEKPKKKRKENRDKDLGADLKEITGAYSGELERTGATISNLRADREELLARIQKLEEEKLLQNRQSLSIRAELDEKKIELTIIRKKLNEEINELKDRLNFFDEKKLILEEKNRFLTQELDKAGQKNKIDFKKVQNRERELEQKLEFLKSDAETQIRNRDLKILELKRKLDAMEFDMESISQQEKRSVESRFELEDKLDKAIKTLRGAITVLEDESQRGTALEALKKNIDM